MLIGRPLPGDAYDEWRFVEGDLHDIHRRVRELDRDAALVVHPESQQLAIARRVPEFERVTGGVWAIARILELRGEPDARVITIMQASDASKVRLRDWRVRRAAWKAAQEERRRKELLDMHSGYAERYVYAHSRRDVGWRPFAAIPRGV